MTNESKITSIDDPAPAASAVVMAPAAPKASKKGAVDNSDKVTLTIHASSEFDGREVVNIGHNERVYQIPRGKPCVVPKVVAQVIVDAVVDRFDPGPQGGTISSQQPRFAYTITPA